MLTEEQKEARKKGIGATESAVVLGLSEYKTAYQLWMEKTGRLEPEDLSNNDAVWWGNELEPVIAKRYAYETGQRLKRSIKTLVHPKYPFMLCHPDRIIVGRKKLVEIKTARFNPDKWGETGTDQVPDEYFIQVQHQLAVTGFGQGDLIVYFKNTGHTAIYTIRRDSVVIEAIEESVHAFWNENVIADVAPELTSISDYKLKYQRSSDSFADATPETIEVITTLKEIRAQKSVHEQKESECLQKIFSIIGDRAGIKIDDRILATWKSDKNGRRSFRLYEKNHG